MDRMDQQAFMKCLYELKETASVQGNMVTEEQIHEQFEGIELNDQQYELILEYLKGAKIGVGETINPEDYMTGDDKKYLNMYLDELKDLPEISDGKKRALLMAVMAGEKAERNELVYAYLPQVVDIAKLYVGQGVSLEDLIGEGNVALTVLMDMLGSQDNPDEADEMIAQMIMQAMEELIEENVYGKEEFTVWAENANKVLETARELSEELLRKVTIDEVCKEGGFDRDFVLDVLEVTGGKIEYIEQ